MFAYRFVQTPKPLYEAYLEEDIGVFIVRLGSQGAARDKGILKKARKNITRIDRGYHYVAEIPANRHVSTRTRSGR
jgi:hypothetical protein